MALFNIIAKKLIPIDWAKVHKEINPMQFQYLNFFPIPSTIGVAEDCIGIFSNGENENAMTEVKKELFIALEILWQNDFIVIDLYKGIEITFETYTSVYNYI